MIGYVIYDIKYNYKKYKVTSGVGLFYLLSHSLIFELTPMMISEITFTFMLFLILKFYFSKSKNKFNFYQQFMLFLYLLDQLASHYFRYLHLYLREKNIRYLFLLSLNFCCWFNFVTAGELQYQILMLILDKMDYLKTQVM